MFLRSTPRLLTNLTRLYSSMIIPTTMKAILVKDGVSKSANGLYMGEAPTPVPKNGEVLIKIKAFGVNRMDIMQRCGQYPLPPGVSTILGVEFSGTIAVGSDKYKEGDAVFGLAYGGAYAQFIAVNEGMVSLKPEGISDAVAAGICENWMTAWQAMYTIAGLEEGKSVLIHAGCSGVGLAAIQLARKFTKGAIYATAGTDEKVKYTEKMGATKGINYKKEDFAVELSKITNGEGVSVIIDFVGQGYWEQNIASLAKEGRLVLLGLMSGAKTVTPVNLLPILFKRLRIEGTTLRSRSLEYQTKLLKEFSEKALPSIVSAASESEGLEVVIHKVYDWSDIIQAHQDMEDALNIGKLVITIPE